MTLSSDLQDDLDNVFFADFNNTATIDGEQIAGYLQTNSHQFLDLDTNQSVFTGPASRLPTLSRQQIIEIDGSQYVYITARPSGSQQNWIVELV
jgi:hypothetical protein